MQEKLISTGEAARLAGLTVRTLQYYDTIGILRASGRTGGGRRYYSERDLVKLEHIVFFRGLGFSLEKIKDIMLDQYLDQGVGELLSLQEQLLYTRIFRLQNSIAAIEAGREIAETGKTPPWMTLAAFMRSLSTVDLSLWKEAEFTEEQKQIFTQDLKTFDDAMAFYYTWRRLSVKAAAFSAAGIPADAPVSQNLAAEWVAMVEKLTHGNRDHISAYLEVDRNRNMWNPAERELMEKAEPYLNEVLAHEQYNKDNKS